MITKGSTEENIKHLSANYLQNEELIWKC